MINLRTGWKLSGLNRTWERLRRIAGRWAVGGERQDARPPDDPIGVLAALATATEAACAKFDALAAGHTS